MAGQLAVEVNVKNVKEDARKTEDTRTSSFICLGWLNIGGQWLVEANI